MKLVIFLVYLLILVESMKIKLLKMNNVFKKSLLNLKELEAEEMDDFLVIIFVFYI